MAQWSGFAPVEATYSIREWFTDYSDGWPTETGEDEVRWWETPNAGIQFRPTSCDGVHACAMRGCVTCDDCEDLPADQLCDSPLPDVVDFQPFWLYKQHQGCDPLSLDPNATYAMLRRELDEQQYAQLARQFHLRLQAEATDVTSPDGPSEIAEGIGTLIRNRGTLGLGGGALIVPGYTMPTIRQAQLFEVVSGRGVGPGRIPIISDPGFPVTGPGGVAPSDGAAYIYVIDQPPAFAILNEAEPGGLNWDWNNPDDRRMFWDDEDPTCENCFKPSIRRRAIFAFNPCAAFAIQVGVK